MGRRATSLIRGILNVKSTRAMVSLYQEGGRAFSIWLGPSQPDSIQPSQPDRVSSLIS